MSFRVVVVRRAQRELEAIPSPYFEKLEQAMLDLQHEPRPNGCKKLKDRVGAWRVRCGQYRMVYEIDDASRTVTILRVAHRKEVYR